jgi:hypothetical protein
MSRRYLFAASAQPASRRTNQCAYSRKFHARENNVSRLSSKPTGLDRAKANRFSADEISPRQDHRGVSMLPLPATHYGPL